MVETQSIDINCLSKDDNGDYKNEIILSVDKQSSSKSLASESELHRILIHLSEERKKNVSGYEVIPSYFTLNVGKNVKRYEKLIDTHGKLNVIYQNSETEDVVKQFVSTFCGAGHSRVQKNLFVEESIIDKLNDIILCGIPKDLIYYRPSKWNAYYAMVTTDSTPVKYMPNIVVIDDFKKSIKEMVDIVEVSGKGKKKNYNVKEPEEIDIEIMPFDGCGLVTPQCAAIWARELKCICNKKSTKDKEWLYIPSCFQFRIIPGIKGEVMVFDLKKFAKKFNVRKIKDIGGKEWDLFDDRIDVILTKSQFKFWDQYMTNGKFDYTLWRNEFAKKCHGYTRTFNIVSYAVHPNDLRDHTMLSYQPLQSINFTNEEIKKVSKRGIELYRDIFTDVDKFLKYRGLISVTDENGNEIVEDNYTPPYYKALLRNKSLFYDEYIRSKIDNDISKLKNNILSGKQIVSGNYQVFMPDLYALAEYAFGLEPKGLLTEPYSLYSDWWNKRDVNEVDIVRNPHIGMEHRIGKLRRTDEMIEWYKYQTTGIISSLYDTLALSLNSADYDGDTVCTTDDKYILDAVRRELAVGHGKLVYKKVSSDTANNSKALNGIRISDTAALMKINAQSFKNSIGSVMDKITNMWSAVNTNSEIANFIKIGVIVGSETIDFAKTGENAMFPENIQMSIKGLIRGHWMRYLEKNLRISKNEYRAVEKAKYHKKSKADIQKLKKFKDYECNMNRLCHYAEEQISYIDEEIANNASQEEKKFNHRSLLSSSPSINREVYRKLKVLHDEYRDVTSQYRTDTLISKEARRDSANRFRYFYDRCRNELLFLEPNINKLLDMLIIIYYGDKDDGSTFLGVEKDILWNAFSNEMIQRSNGNFIAKDIDYAKLEIRHKKNMKYAKENKGRSMNKKKVIIKSLDDEFKECTVTLTQEDRKQIQILINDAYKQRIVTRKNNEYKLKRILTMFIYLSRKSENVKTELRALRENGHLIKDENGHTIKVPVHVYNPHWIQKYSNVPNELTDLALERLTGVNHKYMETAIKWFEKLGILETKVYPNGNTGIRVLFCHYDGEVWIAEDDYNKAGSLIRNYFRN